jgi:hypothetical protein
LGTFPHNRILTREQARFIVYRLAYDRIQQKAKGARYHSCGLIVKLARTFRVSVECIHQIKKRRTWRRINRPRSSYFSSVSQGEATPSASSRGVPHVRPNFHSP